MLGLDFSQDGKSLATVCQDRMIRIFQLGRQADAQISYRHKKLNCTPIDIAFGPTAGHVAVLSSGILFTPATCSLKDRYLRRFHLLRVSIMLQGQPKRTLAE